MFCTHSGALCTCLNRQLKKTFEPDALKQKLSCHLIAGHLLASASFAGPPAFEVPQETGQEIIDRFRLQQGLLLTVRPEQPISLSIEQLRRLTWEEHAAVWRDYVNALAQCLVRMPGCSSNVCQVLCTVHATTVLLHVEAISRPLAQCLLVRTCHCNETFHCKHRDLTTACQHLGKCALTVTCHSMSSIQANVLSQSHAPAHV